MKTRLIIAVPANGETIRLEFRRFLDKAEASAWGELRVRFGFAWETNPGETRKPEGIFSPKTLEERVSDAESRKEGRIGDDDLFITPDFLSVEHLFCHEGDIHLTGPASSEYLESEASRYSSLGWTVYEGYKSAEETGYAKVVRFNPQS